MQQWLLVGGVTVLRLESLRYKIGRKLVGDRTAKARLEEAKITESKFVDDVALLVAVTFVTTAAVWGLTVSLEKTKLLSIGCPEDNMPIQLEDGVTAAVDDFTYLESNITNDSEVANEVGVRLGKAA